MSSLIDPSIEIKHLTPLKAKTIRVSGEALAATIPDPDNPMHSSNPLFHHVLLIEDEPAHALLIERALRKSVGSLTTCGTISRAREQMREQSFDLIVSDLNLPDLHSDEVVSTLRAVEPRTPILVLTSSSALHDGVSAMRAGANDFLVKNFDSHFSEVLQLVLSRLQLAAQAERERVEVTRDRDLLREAIENSKDGLAVALHDGRVRYSNSGFQAFLSSFGAGEQSVCDITSSDIVRGEEILQRLRERLSNLEPGAVWTTEVVHTRDADVAFDLTVSASRDATDDRVCVLWVRDIRERKRRERFHRELLSTTTHDLKGPLGAIAVSCDVLLDKPPVDERANALLERIASSANSAIHLIEEFLSVRRLEEGALIMHPIIGELQPIASRVIESFQLTAKTRQVPLRLESVGEGILGCVDPLGFERVVSNVVSNAIKFSQAGGEVVVSITRTSGGVMLTVRDRGSGMEPTEVQRLFSRYVRLPAASHVPGSGLGLFIVKCIVSAHGGSIDVTSTVGRGTTFEIFLPDAPPCNERGEVLCVEIAS